MQLSTNFTNYIDPNTVIQQPFDSLDLAVESVKRGDTFGVMLFKENYTFALQQRIEDPKSADANTVDQSEVHLYLDFTSTLRSVFGTAFSSVSLPFFLVPNF